MTFTLDHFVSSSPETYTTSFSSKCHQLESRAWLAKQRIQFTKGIMYPRKSSPAYLIWRTLSDKIQQWIWWSTMELMWVSIPNQRNKECKCIVLQNIWIIQRLNNKGIMSFKSRDQEQTLWSRTDKLNRLRGTIDGNLIGRGPAHVLNDIWAGRMNSMIWVRIASIRNILSQWTQNDIDKGCQ